MSQIQNKQKTATTATKKDDNKKPRVKLEKKAFKKSKRRSIKQTIERLAEWFQKVLTLMQYY